MRHLTIKILCVMMCITCSGARAQEAATSSFEQMLAHIYQTHPRLNAERESVRIADEKIAQANAGFRPTLSANAGAGRQREKVAGTDWRYGKDTTASLAATQPLFSGFSTLEQKRAAEARVMAARARLLSVEQNVFFSAINDWLDICEKEKILILSADNLHRMYEFAQATQDRFNAGDGTTTDIAQAESRMAQAEARHAQAEAERDSARASFERNTGLVAPAIDFPALPENLPTSREESEKIAENNPELAQAQHEENASDHDIEAAESSLWPTVYLRGSVSEERSPSFGLNRLRDDSVTLNVSIPLYQGGGEYSRIREAKIIREKTRYDVMDISRDITKRARIAWNNYQAAGSVIAAAGRASDAAGRALSGVQEEQKNGLRTLIEVLNEQSELLAAQIAETQAQKTLRVEAYRLMAALGKLTTEELHVVIAPYDPKEYHDDVKWRWLGTDITAAR